MKSDTSRLHAPRSVRLRSLSLISILFITIVVMPTMIGSIYYGLVASDRYVAEAKFIVRGVSGRQGSGLEALFRTFGISRAEDDAFAVHTYIRSRDAVRALDEQKSLREIFGLSSSADIFSKYPRFWRGDSFEALYEYYLQRVEVSYQPSTGISTLRVSAFNADDTKLVAESLLRLSEGLINRMNDRANADALAYAESEVARAEGLVIASQREITHYRNSELIMDPSAMSVKTLDLIGTLAAELARTRLQLNETIQKSPSNPTIQGLRARIEAVESQIANEKSKIVGGTEALASKISTYERLVLSREFADRNLGAALTTHETSRQEGRQQHLYIETVVSPTLPDEPTEPRRLRNIITILFCCFSLFGMLWLVVAGSREHMHG
jgi:capsular polysaccharide transport system permease protein